jgi:hypothetical protein
MWGRGGNIVKFCHDGIAFMHRSSYQNRIDRARNWKNHSKGNTTELLSGSA